MRDFHRILDYILPALIEFGIEIVFHIAQSAFELLVQLLNDIIDIIKA